MNQDVTDIDPMMIMSTTNDGYVYVQFAMTRRDGTVVQNPDGSVVSRPLEYLKLSPKRALELCEGLFVDARAAAAGRVILPGG